jgi:hypothetical protein
MRANKEDFNLHIRSNDIPKDLGFGLSRISIFKGNIVLRFAAPDDGDRDPVISKFNIESIYDSKTTLEKKLIEANFETKSAQKLIKFIVDKVLDKVEQGKFNS